MVYVSLYHYVAMPFVSINDPDTSASAASFRESQSKDLEMPVLDSSIPGEISITPELKSAFLASLREHKITLRFFSGSWESFDVSAAGGKYDIVLTSETIYRMDSLPSLIKLLRAVCGCEEQSLTHLASSPPSYLCLVAAKVIYFGVGGGVSEFLDAVYGSGDRRSVKAEPVWESKAGVGRKILKMHWNVDNS
jgi:protein-histidine N-methyltransferase